MKILWLLNIQKNVNAHIHFSLMTIIVNKEVNCLTCGCIQMNYKRYHSIGMRLYREQTVKRLVSKHGVNLWKYPNWKMRQFLYFVIFSSFCYVTYAAVSVPNIYYYTFFYRVQIFQRKCMHTFIFISKSRFLSIKGHWRANEKICWNDKERVPA